VGTVEFMVSGEGEAQEAFFLEMNTRLQVEHPVTEAITGVDLVEWQLRVAAGEALPMTQDQLTISGHAFEARLYAEDVPAGFLPATGTLAHLAFDGGGRIDSGVRAGDAISPWYDPMIAKVIAHGPTRATALARLRRALMGAQVAGSVTNRDFLVALTEHAGFAAGQMDTGLIGRDLAGLTATSPLDLALLALAALACTDTEGQDAMAGFSLWPTMAQTVVFDHGETRYKLRVARDGAGWQVDAGAGAMQAVRRGARWVIDGRLMDQAVHVSPAQVSVFGRETLVLLRPDPLNVQADADAGAGVVLAPMPGLVKAVFVAPGDSVEKGARLAVLEAMKMEHTLTAGRDGIVEQVLAQAGDQVKAGAALIALVPEGD